MTYMAAVRLLSIRCLFESRERVTGISHATPVSDIRVPCGVFLLFSYDKLKGRGQLPAYHALGSVRKEKKNSKVISASGCDSSSFWCAGTHNRAAHCYLGGGKCVVRVASHLTAVDRST